MTRARESGRLPGTSAAPGFTLVEMSIAVMVIALILGGMLVPLVTQVDQRQVSETEKMLQEIREALIGYAVAKGNLPCPDTGTNGSENVTVATGLCTTVAGGIAAGRLPYLDLGLGNSDLWGNRFTYVVNELFARRSPATPFSLATAGTDVRICTSQACTTVYSSTAAFAVISHGKNGAGAINFTTNNANAASSSVDEQENYDTDKDVITRPLYTGGAATSEFDDVVVWLSRYMLFNRMVAAGKLP
jgi:prepilin-type N-terminal cleavage/methylation domain-containing protein